VPLQKYMSTKKQLGTITILVKDRQQHSVDVNRILTENSRLILARLGVNVARTCVTGCTAMVTVAIEGTTKEINGLTEKLDSLYGIVAKANIVTEE